MRSCGWALIQSDGHPYGKRKSGCRHTQREGCVETQGEDGHLQAEQRDLRGNHLADTLILDFSFWNCEKINLS